MDKKSFTHKLSGLIKLQMLALVMLLIVFVWISYRTVKKELDTTSANFLSTYGSQLENRIAGMEKVLSKFLYGNTDLNMIRSEDKITRHYASVRLQKSMADIMAIDMNGEFLVVAEGDYEVNLDSGSAALSADEKQALRDYTMELSKGNKNMATQWEMARLGEKMYLYKASVQNRRAAAIYLSVDTLLNTISNPELRKSEFFLTDREGTIYGLAGFLLLETEPGASVRELFRSGAANRYYDLLEGRFRLYLYEEEDFFLGWMRNGMVILAFLVILLYLFTAYLKRDVEKELIFPMKELTVHMERIQQGDYELRMEEDSNNREFSMLTGTFNKLMDEIINLKIRNYEKKLELQEADQKYIRLQLRPHFFLNAMATVSSLSEKGKAREIQQYIQALSKNIRYMFASGMYTVPVKEEIRHVENYLKMQELKYPGCVFSYIELPEELEKWKIPQMLLHTLVENEYKYAVSRNETLMLLIKVSAEEFDGEEMLLIEVEDDGKGYPEEVLGYMNGDEERHSREDSRVGLWSIRRLLELMYDRKGLLYLENVQPHGALNRIYIPQQAVHEIRRDDTGESGVE